jgi:hypothetical protein
MTLQCDHSRQDRSAHPPTGIPGLGPVPPSAGGSSPYLQGDAGVLPNLQNGRDFRSRFRWRTSRPRILTRRRFLAQCRVTRAASTGLAEATPVSPDHRKPTVTTCHHCHHLAHKVVTEKHKQFQCGQLCHHLSPPFSLTPYEGHRKRWNTHPYRKGEEVGGASGDSGDTIDFATIFLSPFPR